MSKITECEHMVGKTYRDRDGVTVTVVKVEETKAAGPKMTKGVSLTVTNGKHEMKIGKSLFFQKRGFKEC